MERIQNLSFMNYNQKTLPKTQFEMIDLKKIKLDTKSTDGIHYYYDNKTKKFFIDIDKINKNIIIVGSYGDIKIIQDFKKFEESEIKNNLSEFNIYDVLDVAYVNNEIFISSTTSRNNKTDCYYFELLKSEVNMEKLKFEKIYQTKNCMESRLGGRIHEYVHKNMEGILVTLSDRIIVMANGKISKEFNRNEATQEDIFKAAVG